MHLLRYCAPLLAAALSACAAPTGTEELKEHNATHLVTRQDTVIDFKPACEDWKPPTSEMGIIAATSTAPGWDGSNLGISSGSNVAIWYNSYCDIVQVKEWQPQNPGFEVKFGAYFDGVGPNSSVQMTIVATVGTIGNTFGTGEIGVELNGVKRQVFCQDDETNLQGLESRSYRACNFVHGGLYPY